MTILSQLHGMRSKNPLRIILTVQYSPWSPYSGGGQRSVHNLAATLAGRGHDVHVIFTKTFFDQINVPDELPYNVHWANFPGYRSRRESFFRPMASLSVRRIVKNLCKTSTLPTIVHSNGEEAASLYKLKWAHRFGLIVTPRYSFYPDKLTNNTIFLDDKLYLRLFEWKFMALGKAIRKADRVCPPSQWAANEILKAYRIDSKKITVVHNGVPSEFLQFQQDEIPAKGPIFFFGRLSKDKGVDILLKAYAQMPRPKPKISIAGTGDGKEFLVRLSKELEIETRVNFIPWQNHDQLGKLLSESRLCVLPSRHENYSLAILSAMCVGVPTISTNVGGTSEIIRDHETGLLVKPEDVKGLAKAMQYLLSNPEESARLGKNAQNDVRTTKTWDIACENLENIYQDVLRELF